jgi:hypothetical protein
LISIFPSRYGLTSVITTPGVSRALPIHQTSN